MALRFIDGFDHYGSTDLTEFDQKYSASNSATIDLVDRRTGLGALKMTGGTPHITVGLDAQTTWIVGFGFKTSSKQTDDVQDLISFTDGSSYSPTNTHVSFQILGDGNFRIVRGMESGDTTIATGTTRVDLDDGWHYIEFKVFHHDTLGTYEVRVDEENVFSGTGVDTINALASNPTSSHIRISRIEGGVTTTWVDDLYVCDGTGSQRNDFLGDSEVKTLFPIADGALEDWPTLFPASPTDSFAKVDETPPDDNTSYVETNVSTDQDSFDMTALTGTGAILGFQLVLFANFQSGTPSIQHLARVGGSNFNGSSKAMTSSYVFYTNIWEDDPDISDSWTVSGVNAAEFGMEYV